MRNRFMRACLARTASPYGRLGGSLRLAKGVVIATAGLMVVAGCGSKDHSAKPSGAPPAATAKLVQTTTFVSLHGIPQEADSTATGDGTVVHPTMPVPVSATPGGPPVAVLPNTQLGGPTWVPVVETRPGWRRVLLPSRPNHSVGWIATGGMLQTARSPYVIKVDTSTRQLTLLKSGRRLGNWTVAVGAAKTPTPTGRTFLLASLAPGKPTYSPLILPVGAHSQTLDTFGGGPGTVAFHGWPQRSIFGKAVTHGCVRVPSDALTQLSKVPLGSIVIITN